MSKGWWKRLTEEERQAYNRKKSDAYWAARREHGYFSTRGRSPETLCWTCQRAVKECPWSANFEPVDGWEADETKIMGPYGVIPSYFVKKCPLYDPDPIPQKRKRRRKNGKES